MQIEEYKKRNKILQGKIILEIEKVKRGQSEKNILQLQGILKELQDSRTNNNIPLYYPHIIADSWDYSDTLGIELMELAEVYR